MASTSSHWDRLLQSCTHLDLDMLSIVWIEIKFGGLLIIQTQAIELQEIQVFFEGCLPNVIEDERNIVRNDRVRAQTDPLKMDEKVCALTFETKLNLELINDNVLFYLSLPYVLIY